MNILNSVLDNIIVVLASTIIIILFLITTFTFFVKIRSIKNTLSKFNLDATNFNLGVNSHLLSITNRYQATIHENKSEVSAQNYYNLAGLTSKSLQLNYYSSFSNLLVGLGILGTFIGLSIGVYSFSSNISTSSNQTDAITKGIEDLLSGMGTAFVSSVLGMLFSIIFSIIYKRQISELQNRLIQLSAQLDEKFLKKKWEYEDERDIRFIKSLESLLLTTKINGATTGLGNLTKELVAEYKRQSEHLQSFSSDLADIIYSVFERLQGQDGSLTQIINDRINELIQVNTKGFRELKEASENPVQNLMDQLVESLNQTFQKMSEDLTSSIAEIIHNVQAETGGKINDTLDQTVKTMSVVSEGLTDLPNQINALDRTLLERIESLGVSNTLSMEMINSVNQSIKNQFELIERQEESIKNIDTYVTSFSSRANEMNISLDHIKNSSRILKDTIGIFESHQANYIKSITEAEKTRAEVFNNINSTIESTLNMSENSANNFRDINHNLKSVFAEISKGLNQYNDRIEQNIQNELKVYAENVSKILNGLNDTISRFENGITELGDILDKNR